MADTSRDFLQDAIEAEHASRAHHPWDCPLCQEEPEAEEC